MKLAAIFLISLLFSCTTQTKFIKLEETRVSVRDGIEIDKAKAIISQFLIQEQSWHIRGNIRLELFPEKYRKFCIESVKATESKKEFCNSLYMISHSSDSYCFGSSNVLENCSNGECKYRISNYEEVCE